MEGWVVPTKIGSDQFLSALTFDFGTLDLGLTAFSSLNNFYEPFKSISLIFRQLQTLESRINSDMRNILELLTQVAGPGPGDTSEGLRGQPEPETRVQLRPHQPEVSPDPVSSRDSKGISEPTLI